MRPPPEGWTLCRWPSEVIALLKTGEVTEISLDHDLGDTPQDYITSERTGMDVMTWLEEQVFTNHFKPPIIHIHTANSVAGRRMEKIKIRIDNFVNSDRNKVR